MPTLVLSPSQQSANEYAGGPTTNDSEKVWMTKLAMRVKALWDAQKVGITCLVVQKGSWSANADESNRLGATEHVALHTNAGGGHGTEVFHYPTSTKGKALATALYKFIAPASDQPDRGVKTSSTLGELSRTKAPAVIIEYAFHDNATEAQEIRTSIEEYAVATVKWLCAYYGKTYKEPVVTPPVVIPITAPTKKWVIVKQDDDGIILQRQ